MLLVIWVVRLELNFSELGLAVITFMFGALVFLFNEMQARKYARSTCTDVCVVPLV